MGWKDAPLVEQKALGLLPSHAPAGGWRSAPLEEPPEPVGRAESGLRGGIQGASMGFGDEAAAAVDAALPSWLRNAVSDEAVGQGATFGDRYRSARDYYRGQNAAAEKANPGTYLAGQLGGAILTTRGVASAPAAAGVGATEAVGYSNADLAGMGDGAVADLAADAAGGSVLGAGGYAAGKGLGKIASFVARKIGRGAPAAATEIITAQPQSPTALRRVADKAAKPIPEAEFLRSQGVPLTVGQSNPRSALGQIEEASTSLRAVGPVIKGQREKAVEAWQQIVLGKAAPPGGQAPAAGGLSERLDAIYQSFTPAYEAVKGDLVYPAIHMGGSGKPLQTLGKSVGAFDEAVADPSVLADDVTRSTVKRFLDNQLTLLPPRRGAIGQVPVENMLSMRSNVREAWRLAKRQQKHDAAALLDNAEDAITQAIESQVRPETSEALRAVDRQYRNFKIVEDAVSRAGDSPSGFTPGHLTAAIKASTDKGAFARGGGGELRDYSKAGRAVFESVSPPTGARLLTVGPLGEFVTGPMTFLVNRPKVPELADPEFVRFVRGLAARSGAAAPVPLLDEEERR